MIKVKAKSAQGRRIQKAREPQLVESVKSAMFIRGSTTSAIVGSALKDLYSLKKPDAVYFSKKNEIHPFDDSKPLEFFSQKNDAALFALANHSKKRPHNLTLIRMFDYQVLDMLELGIVNGVAMDNFKSAKCGVGNRPLMVFTGELFNTREEYIKLRNLLIDFFRGEVSDGIDLKGIDHVISVVADPTSGVVHFRVYVIQLKKSDSKLPRVEMEEMGPRLDFVMRRYQFAPNDVMKEALRVVKEKKVKNIQSNDLAQDVGRIHMQKQDLNKLQTRKMKGLKRAVEEDEEGDEETTANMDVDEEVPANSSSAKPKQPKKKTKSAGKRK
ncbi:rRNA-binding ribosome biosynthesis protein rpf2 [Nowakowskiella sp. JEL0407]|nr:rRNA-binding ribosome biosynthesis protein rpf2 [Nowakowskiella sp. JEL0407]